MSRPRPKLNLKPCAIRGCDEPAFAHVGDLYVCCSHLTEVGPRLDDAEEAGRNPWDELRVFVDERNRAAAN